MLIAVSMSSRTSGSAFSLIDSDAEVCWIKTCNSPISYSARSGIPLMTSRVIKWNPRFLAVNRTGYCDQCKVILLVGYEPSGRLKWELAAHDTGQTLQPVRKMHRRDWVDLTVSQRTYEYKGCPFRQFGSEFHYPQMPFRGLNSVLSELACLSFLFHNSIQYVKP